MRTAPQSSRYRAASVTPEAENVLGQLSKSLDDEPDLIPVGIICLGSGNLVRFMYTGLVSDSLMQTMLKAASEQVSKRQRILQ